ncbi:MAG: cation:proton antiporter [Bacteroidaceae bacterium]|nr:cation:proton antiporter [Bacteroidaceae bacterium]
MNEQLPTLISDLALILIIAGVVTVVFKRLKQPLVLGYIVAGFLAGPHMPYMPSISDEGTVHVWSQIGIIFLMFSLGLEFSFKKILKLGFSPILTACFIMGSMMLVGFGVGHFLGWSNINSWFLGGMLSMSSTTIIYKAYNDLGLLNKRFASRVMSVLVLEDILGIVLMVVLSALAASNHLKGGELLGELSKLGFFLLLWFIVGMWIIPLFLRKNSGYINKETLMIVSIGLCFLMVVIADKVGYSPALGAFMMGSILAETIEAERIDESISSVKDLFGAIFFVSVGMMVQLDQLMEHWWPITLLVGAVLFGQMIFGTLGYLLFGSSIGEAIQSGFSMTQIGEFAFIIAQLGISLGVTDDYLYPVVVAVSIITTFTTPHMMKLSMAIRNSMRSAVGAKPAQPKKKNSGVSARNVTGFVEEQTLQLTTKTAWHELLKSIALVLVIYGTLTIAVIELLFVSMLLVLREWLGHWAGNAVCGIVVLIMVSVFIRPIVMKKKNSIEAKFLRSQGRIHCVLLQFIFALRIALITCVVYFFLNYLSPYRWYWHIVASVIIVFLIIRSRWIQWMSIRLERIFLGNLRSREQLLPAEDGAPAYARRLRGRDLHIAQLTLPDDSSWVGKTLAQLRIGGKNAVHVTAIIRKHRRLNIPGGDTLLLPADIIEVVGDDDSIEQVAVRMDVERTELAQTDEQMQLQQFVVGKNSPMVGMLIKQSGIRDKHRCMVVGFEDSDGGLTIASADRMIEAGDKLWLAGVADKLEKMKVMLDCDGE